MFGGQVDGEFFNDLWAFDLNSREFFIAKMALSNQPINCLVRTKAMWKLIEPVDGSPKPSRRTGHICVSYGGKIIMYVHKVHRGFSRVLTLVFYKGLAASMVSTTTMTPGLSTSRPGRGRS